MVAANPQQVASMVQESLRTRGSAATGIRVVSEDVRRGDDGGDWWWVPVEYSGDSGRLYEYYDIFAQVEESLEETSHVNVLLIPRITYSDQKTTG